jgi:hypothetical protein
VNAEKKPSPWQFFADCVVAPELGGVCARVTVVRGRGMPRFSVELGHISAPPSSMFKRFFKPEELVTQQLAVVSEMAMAAMAKERDAWSAEESARASARMTEQQGWERRAAEQQQRKAHKKVRHEANLQRRREEDRQRTQASKSGSRTK